MIDLDYAADLPLNLVVEPGADRPGVVLAGCRFDNVEGEPVTGWLAQPSGPRTEAPAGVVYQHSTGGRGAFVAEAVAVAAAGGVALSIGTVQSLDPVADGRRSILAIRRAADVLQREYGAGRLGCVGHSAGAMYAGTVSGIDRRFACFVFESGLSGLSFHFRDSPVHEQLRATTPPDLFAATIAAMSPYDAVHFVADAAPAALLFQSARFDVGVTAAESEAFFAAASEPKELRWYDCGHVLTDPAAFVDRARFLGEHLDLELG
ncbi:prolyl oligopeptidase family serine peptidase [Pseudonocardia sp. CA-107938]|uniref:prolyl oligopeptidase family serine peptidase n=1 Tax=Pseudonocardia sp. CA-107938 TaxID=3240021 RepID=UPI003D8C7BDB